MNGTRQMFTGMCINREKKFQAVFLSIFWGNEGNVIVKNSALRKKDDALSV